MASPQVENGFTRIANELLEALMTADLNGTQFRIMLAVIRESYGRQRTQAKLSYSRIADLVEQPRTVVGRNLKQLIGRNFLRHSGGDLSTWSVQKDYSQWAGSDQSVTRDQTVTSDQMVPKSSDQMVPTGSDQSVTQLKKEERKKESGGVAPKNAAAAGDQREYVTRLIAIGLTPGQAKTAVGKQEFTTDILDRLTELATRLEVQKKNAAAIIWPYLEAGTLPKDTPPPKVADWKPRKPDGSIDYDRWNALIAQDRRWRTGPVL